MPVQKTPSAAIESHAPIGTGPAATDQGVKGAIAAAATRQLAVESADDGASRSFTFVNTAEKP